MIKTIPYNFLIAAEAILQNKIRAILTSLGIICGVASVIAMLAIGKGAEQEILEKMKLLGTNNIIIKPLDKKDMEKKSEEQDNKKEEKKRYSPGLTILDARSIKTSLPHIANVSPEVVLEKTAIREGKKRKVNVVGVEPAYFETNRFLISEGRLFNSMNISNSMQVCVIGGNIKTKFFPLENPLGKQIKCGDVWLTVIGVLQSKNITEDNIKTLGIRDYNNDIYIPLTTMLLRFGNTSLITKQDLKRGFSGDASSDKKERTSQIDRIVIEVTNSEYSSQISEIINRMLLRRHNNVVDYEIIVPQLLLEQEQKTKSIFNFVLGAIASISLIVGGIGIMNIMLASVMERTKEIGIRLAVGAKKSDIRLQFLSEAIAISLTGGFIGILAGVGLSFLIESMSQINTIVTPFSVVLSFFVSISVGLIFGFTPAQRAAQQDPIDLLRYE